MITIGEYNNLLILRETSVGIYLGDPDTGEDVLLPNKYCPEVGSYDLGDELRVFVYLDYAERVVATNIEPGITLNTFALLQVASVEEVGAFMDWGLEKHLLVPFSEQKVKMEEGRWYIVYLDIDAKTDRLYGTTKFRDILQNDILTVRDGQEVDLTVLKETDLGYNVVVENEHRGLLYKDEVETPLRVGEQLTGYIKRIRPDNKIDITTQPLGYRNTNDANEQLILDKLEDNDGMLPYHDKSDPDDIRKEFGLSKKAFKKAVGGLYKQKQILLVNKGIKKAE